MATAVFFHAHPDDEAISTGGTIARMSAEGHRVVLVVATNGDVGEVDDGFLAPGETLAERRVAEVRRSGAILGVHRIELLGYRDSGMMGEADNHHDQAFWAADIDAAAERLAAVLRQESADLLTVYDGHGGYGHPDHIQVHRVGHRAAQLAATELVYEATMNRDRVRALRGGDGGEGIDAIGLSDAELTAAIDVRQFAGLKRQAMLAHGSQIAPDSWFVDMDDERFERVWGTEWFRQTTPPFPGHPVADRATSLVPD